MKKLSQIRAGRKRRDGIFDTGFTLIELMIVITIILILIGMAAQRYDKSVQRSREATLKQDLMRMRQSSDNYPLNNQAPPQPLLDLVQVWHLPKVPLAHITGPSD